MLVHKITPDDFQQRVDLFLQHKLPQLSRSYIKKLAQAGQLLLDDKPINAGYKLKQVGQLKLNYNFDDQSPLPNPKLRVIFEDEFLIVVNKPSGLIMHARSRYWHEPSIAASLRQHCQWPPLTQPPQLADLRYGLVHRLDKGTSGVVVCAKHEKIKQALQQQFRQKIVKKTYLGIVSAKPDLPNEGLIDKPLKRNLANRQRFKVDAQGRLAQTVFKIKTKFAKYYLLELQPLTGRTHQIRVHLASLQLPILGDTLYDGLPAPRLMLHAQNISFTHPVTHQTLNFKVTCPIIFKKICQNNA